MHEITNIIFNPNPHYLIYGLAVTEDVIDMTFDVTITEIMPTRPVVKSVLEADKFTIVE